LLIDGLFGLGYNVLLSRISRKGLLEDSMPGEISVFDPIA
jgi:hypothetical protein